VNSRSGFQLYCRRYYYYIVIITTAAAATTASTISTKVTAPCL